MAPMQPSFAIKCVKLLQQWFEEKQQQIETLDQQLKKLHLSMETLALQRKGWFFNGKMKKKIVDSISLMFIGMSHFCCTDLGGEYIPFVYLLQFSTRISGFNPLTPRSNF